MKVVLVMFMEGERREFPLTGEKSILGRRQDSHLRIPTGDVSRQHCALVVKNAAVIAKDLGSSNGTFVNGKRIAEAILKPGDRLRIGPVTFVVQIDGRPADIKPEDAAPTTSVAPTTEAAEDEKTFELTEEDLDLDDLAVDKNDEDRP